MKEDCLLLNCTRKGELGDEDTVTGTSGREAETDKDFGSGFVGLQAFNSRICFLSVNSSGQETQKGQGQNPI